MNPIAFAALNKRNDSLSDSEFLQMAESFAKKCNVFHGIYDERDGCRVVLYLSKTVIFNEDIDTWLELIRSSDKYTMTTLMEKICVTLYRLKR